MRESEKRYLIVFLLLFIISGFVYADELFSKRPARVQLDKLASTVGEWRGSDIIVEERTKHILQTNYVLVRKYLNHQGQSIYLSIIYYADNKTGFHNPESCNTGAGSYVMQKDVLPVLIKGRASNSMSFTVNRLVMGGARGDKVILYFYVSGDYMTHDYLKFRLHMLKRQIVFHTTGGAQIQLQSALDLDAERTTEIVSNFLRELIPLLPDHLS